MAIVNDFRDLIVWQEAHKLVLSVYKTAKSFPKDEQFALSPQIRRAVVSISSNIAEGFGRKQSKDKEHFYVVARGSLDETRNQLLIAKDLGYISEAEYEAADLQAETVARLLGGLLRSHKNF